MGLLNLRTSLKSLKYGHDRPDGGSSSQPYIVTDIPDHTSALSKIDNDFLLRGGLTAVSTTAKDLERLGRYFTDTKSPSGLLFIAKQELLSRVAVRTETSGFLNQGIYTPAATLAQAAVSAFGLHLPTNPDFVNYPETSLYYNVAVNRDNDKDNRLVKLFKSNILPVGPYPQDILSYTGGPGSTIGIGSTHIKVATQPLFANLPTSQIRTGNSFNKQGDNFLVYTQKQIADVGINKDTRSAPSFIPKIQDFRKLLRANLGTSAGTSTILSDALDYNINNIANRTNIGDPGSATAKNLYSYVKGGGTISNQIYNSYGAASDFSFDKINALPIYNSETVDKTPQTNDLISFRIAAIDNDSPSFKTFIHFRAFLNSISDNYSADWSSVQYIGRGDKFWNYSGFGRNINLSWTVAAQSKAELIPMYKKLNYLASNLAPDYSKNGYMRGPLIQLTIGGYLQEVPGFITNLTFDISEETPWEIGIGDNENTLVDNSVKQLPHIIKVSSFNFVPIQEFIPSKQKSFNGDSRFISLANDSGENSYDGPIIVPTVPLEGEQIVTPLPGSDQGTPLGL